MKSTIFTLFLMLAISMQAQDQEDYYYQIPEAPKEYTPGNVVGRMVDGLGFRYYWATYKLTTKDLSYKPSKEARTSEETIDHILSLSQVILNSALKVASGTPQPKMTYEEKRKKTLENLKKASAIFKKSKDLSEFKIIFKRGDKTTEYPFWNQINGPISDALWHVGQVVTFRRASGNPFPKGVSVLRGVKRD
ncbi:MAG: hypothetical protein JXQ93_05230 [Flavobacteriaceae bacterium]